MEQGNASAAEAALRRALDRDATYRPAQLRLAEAVREAGRLEEARGIYEQVLRADSGSAEAHYGVGRIRAAQGDAAGAAEALRKGCEAFPAYGAAHFALAQAYRRLGDAGKAKEHLALYEKHKLAAPPAPDELMGEVRALSVATTEYLRQEIGRAHV